MFAIQTVPLSLLSKRRLGLRKSRTTTKWVMVPVVKSASTGVQVRVPVRLSVSTLTAFE